MVKRVLTWPRLKLLVAGRVDGDLKAAQEYAAADPPRGLKPGKRDSALSYCPRCTIKLTLYSVKSVLRSDII